jgi:hypothetical protein
MTKLEELKATYKAEDAAYSDALAADDAAAWDGAAAWDARKVAHTAYQEELKKSKEITMYSPELNMDISGWYEAEDGVGFVEIGEALDVNDLANKLLDKYGDDIIGVDMELEGRYCNGSFVYDAAIMLELTRIGG